MTSPQDSIQTRAGQIVSILSRYYADMEVLGKSVAKGFRGGYAYSDARKRADHDLRLLRNEIGEYCLGREFLFLDLHIRSLFKKLRKRNFGLEFIREALTRFLLSCQPAQISKYFRAVRKKMIEQGRYGYKGYYDVALQ